MTPAQRRERDALAALLEAAREYADESEGHGLRVLAAGAMLRVRAKQWRLAERDRCEVRTAAVALPELAGSPQIARSKQ